MAFITHRRRQEFEVKVYLGDNFFDAEIFPGAVTVNVLAPTAERAEEIAKEAIREALENGMFLAKPVTDHVGNLVWED
jgi:hypothetical protein